MQSELEGAFPKAMKMLDNTRDRLKGHAERANGLLMRIQMSAGQPPPEPPAPTGPPEETGQT